MDKQWFWTPVLVSGLFLCTVFLVLSITRGGQVCSFQVRYALSDTVAHRDIDKPRPSRSHMEEQLRAQFVPNVCSREQFEEIFPKEAGNWGW